MFSVQRYILRLEEDNFVENFKGQPKGIINCTVAVTIVSAALIAMNRLGLLLKTKLNSWNGKQFLKEIKAFLKGIPKLATLMLPVDAQENWLGINSNNSVDGSQYS